MRWFCIAAALLFANSAFCQEVIDVRKSGAEKIAIDTGGLKAGGGQADVFRKVLLADLQRSGWFVLMQGKGSLKLEGLCQESAGRVSASLAVNSVGTGRAVMKESYAEASADVRRMAHKAADDIVWAVHRKKGIASTRIAMIGNRGGKKDIFICDSDGANLRQLTQDGAIVMSPNWAPDAQALTYTSYADRNRPYAYLHNLASKSRRAFSAFPGMNSGARIAPDGSRAAIILAKDGTVDLYTMDLSGGGLRRQTASKASEASPAWMLDGSGIVFVSDRTGTPQLYLKQTDGKEQRLTFVGRENVAPDCGPDGMLAWCSRRSGRYEIVVMKMGSGQKNERSIRSDGYDYEDPSWAPDGRHIVCTRTGGYRSEVVILDTMEPPDAPFRLTSVAGEWYSPAWSPK
jgi:TolB protein